MAAVISACSGRRDSSSLYTGTTIETRSYLAAFEAAYAAAGLPAADHIVVVTDPGSPLDASARAAGYTVFNADPHVGGRFSALTAFGLVPSGLAGADIATLLHDAASAREILQQDDPDNPAIRLAAAISGQAPAVDKLGLVPVDTPIQGLPDWAEQLVAESLGKEGTGILPVVLDTSSPELTTRPTDLVIARLVAEASDAAPEEIAISGTLGEQLMLWEYAISMVGKVLGINPFDQPDVESAKAAARSLLAERPEPVPAVITEGILEVRGTSDALAGAHTISAAISQLFSLLSAHNGYLSIQAYLDRPGYPQAAELRDIAAEKLGRPVTFGWGPRFLHSTGQYHKGGPAEGVYLQITAVSPTDVDIPGIPFSFGQLVQAQAAGDAAVLAEHGRPVLSVNITSDIPAGIQAIRDILSSLE